MSFAPCVACVAPRCVAQLLLGRGGHPQPVLLVPEGTSSPCLAGFQVAVCCFHCEIYCKESHWAVKPHNYMCAVGV